MRPNTKPVLVSFFLFFFFQFLRVGTDLYLNFFYLFYQSYYKELVSCETLKTSNEQNLGRSNTMHNVLFCAHTLWLN